MSWRMAPGRRSFPALARQQRRSLLPSHAVVGTGAFSVQIAPECSGYEGIGMIVTFSVPTSAIRPAIGARAWLLLPIGAVLVWLANVVRMFTLIQVGTWISSRFGGGRVSTRTPAGSHSSRSP